MISEFETEQLLRLRQADTQETWVKAAIRSSNPVFLQRLALEYNWDDGYVVPTAIANNDSCDLGTAITLFWLSEAIALYTQEIKPTASNRAWVEFSERLSADLLYGRYELGPVSYAPDLFRVQRFKY